MTVNIEFIVSTFNGNCKIFCIYIKFSAPSSVTDVLEVLAPTL